MVGFPELEKMFDGFSVTDSDFRTMIDSKEIIVKEMGGSMESTFIKEILDEISDGVFKIILSDGQEQRINFKKEWRLLNSIFGENEITTSREAPTWVISNKSKIEKSQIPVGYNAKHQICMGDIYLENHRQRLMDSIKTDNIFVGTIVELMPFGMFVNLGGIKCFLPGSLSPSNDSRTYQYLLGTTWEFTVELWDERRGMFLVNCRSLRNIKEEFVKLDDICVLQVFKILEDGILVKFNESSICRISYDKLSPLYRYYFKKDSIYEGELMFARVAYIDYIKENISFIGEGIPKDPINWLNHNRTKKIKFAEQLTKEWL